jgi:hypothetical protein
MTDTLMAEKFYRSLLQIIEADGAFTVWQQIGGTHSSHADADRLLRAFKNKYLISH